ncbi:DUF4168 domain-containing protein [Aurantiacibacter hainanensis]|uniref:DUF4168 domain-containing protein n=1 Tax=Aurantiacibacter hainanensis TaxID=3076114 RepID=UPI0030C73F5E
MKTVLFLAAGPLALVATAAAAQDGHDPLDPAHMENDAQAEAEALPPEGTPPAASSQDTAADDFTDAQIASFVSAAMAINDLDDTLAADERREQARAILASEGLDYQTYAAIGQAAQSDPVVAQRVRDAMPQAPTEADG